MHRLEGLCVGFHHSFSLLFKIHVAKEFSVAPKGVTPKEQNAENEIFSSSDTSMDGALLSPRKGRKRPCIGNPT